MISAQLWSDPVGARQLRAPSPRAPDHKRTHLPHNSNHQHSNNKTRDHLNSFKLSLVLLELKFLSFSNFRAVLLRNWHKNFEKHLWHWHASPPRAPSFIVTVLRPHTFFPPAGHSVLTRVVSADAAHANGKCCRCLEPSVQFRPIFSFSPIASFFQRVRDPAAQWRAIQNSPLFGPWQLVAWGKKAPPPPPTLVSTLLAVWASLLATAQGMCVTEWVRVGLEDGECVHGDRQGASERWARNCLDFARWHVSLLACVCRCYCSPSLPFDASAFSMHHAVPYTPTQPHTHTYKHKHKYIHTNTHTHAHTFNSCHLM